MAIEYEFGIPHYIGETTRGTPNGVFWGPHTQIRNNNAPGTMITGAPGSGKTNLSLTIAAQAAICGMTVVVLDYKGDFLSLIDLEKDTGKAQVWPVGTAEEKNGIAKGFLDPFNMSNDPKEQLQLSMNLIDIFIGGLTPQQKSRVQPIIQDIIDDNKKRPNMSRVVSELRSSPDQIARDLGTELFAMKAMKNSSVCFAPDSAKFNKGPKRSIELEGRLTIATMLGLELPSDKESAQNTLTGRMSSGIFYLLADYVRKLLKESTDGRPKLLIIDEAWAILSSPAGVQVVKETSLLGRSRDVAFILATQNYSHIAQADIYNTISTHFAFSARSKDAKDVIENLELDETSSFAELVSDLQVGECLMKDWGPNKSHYSTVDIIRWREDWKQAFDTNPYQKKLKEKAGIQD